MPVTRRETWWKERTDFEQKLIRLLIYTLALALIIFLTLLFLLFYIPNKSNVMCTSPECVAAAATILKHMDIGVDPCDDFYRFACGNFINHTVVPDDCSRIDTFTSISDQMHYRLKLALEEPIKQDDQRHLQLLKKFYKACLNKDRIGNDNLDKAKKLLKSVGGWPVVTDSVSVWYDGDFSWINAILRLRKEGLDFKTLIDINVYRDLKYPKKWIIWIEPPTFELETEHLLKSFDTKKIQNYFERMIEIAVMFGAERGNAKEQLKESLFFEMDLANITRSHEESNTSAYYFNKMKVHELDTTFPGISWQDFLSKLFVSNISLIDEVNVSNPSYLKKLMKLIRKTPRKVVANYLMWRAVSSLMPLLTDELLQKQLIVDHLRFGINRNPKRWKHCVDTMKRNLQRLIGVVYVQKYEVNENLKKHLLLSEIVDSIKLSFMENLKQLDWMDEETRTNAVNKVNAMQLRIGYPDELLDGEILDEFYAPLYVDEEDYFYSSLNISIFNTNKSFERLWKQENESNWIEYVAVSKKNLFQAYSENTIDIRVDILQDTLFNANNPRFMNFATIGSIIGHEIAHGFDFHGIEFDKDGSRTNWWQKNTKDTFVNKLMCIVKLYNNYKIPDNNLHIVNENIADNVGIKQTYLAYKKWINQNGEEDLLPGLNYTPNQLFWISYAQMWCLKTSSGSLEVSDDHAPNELRVIVPLSNQEHFSEDFMCPKGSKMNSEEKCPIW